jgi:hypothetical protein
MAVTITGRTMRTVLGNYDTFGDGDLKQTARKLGTEE